MPRKSKNKKTLDETHPHLLEEWDYVRNAIAPDQITHGSNKRVLWLCGGCGHSWKALVYNRTGNNSGCPVCANQVVTETNNLLVKFPEIADEWDSHRNNFPASSVMPGTDRKVFWKCKNCQNKWKASVSSRTNKNNSRGCPKCSFNKRTQTINRNKIVENGSLADVSPDLVDDWDYINNVGFCPETIQSKSKKKVYWVCSCCRHHWKVPVKNRSVDGNGCPNCSGGSVSRVSQKWLDSLGIKIREYYIKELNIRVDGYDPETNTVYEFLGDYWHGNPMNSKYPANKLNKHNNKTFEQLYLEWRDRKRSLQNQGFNVEFIWESDFKVENG